MRMPINEGLLKFICWEAAKEFDHKGMDGLFNLACWSNAYCRITNREGAIDGNIIRVILTGRDWVKPQEGETHWRLFLK